MPRVVIESARVGALDNRASWRRQAVESIVVARRLLALDGSIRRGNPMFARPLRQLIATASLLWLSLPASGAIINFTDAASYFAAPGAQITIILPAADPDSGR